MMGGENRLLYSSDYPHQDFDLPTRVSDLAFLSETAKAEDSGWETGRSLVALERVPKRRL